MNIPYVKQYDEKGLLTNPIKGKYINSAPNRKDRRAHLQKERFFGESKNHHLTVLRTGKYLRSRQLINDGSRKVVEHYVKQ